MYLLEWQTLLFLVPIGLGALYLLLLAATGIGGEHGVDGGADTDASADAGADVDQDVSGPDLDHDVGAAELDHDVSAEAAAELDHDVSTEGPAVHSDVAHASVGHAGFGLGAVADFLGLGRVPMSVLLMSYCFVWGVAGILGLAFLGKDPAWLSIAIAGGAAVVITGQLAGFVGRLIPSVETYSTPPRALLGLTGKVLYTVTDTSGVVRLRDERASLRDVACRVAGGTPPIAAGSVVVLQRFDRAARVFQVAAAPASAPGAPQVR